MMSTDDEHEINPPDDPAWLRYERDVREVLDKIDDSTVQHNVTRTGALSMVERQIDVLVEGRVIGSKILIVVECKHYAKPLGIGKIDEFVGKLVDLRVSRGILYALNGLTRGAQARAAAAYPEIEVRDLSLSTGAPDSFSWDQYLIDAFKFGDCGNPNCSVGDVRWSDSMNERGKEITAGTCSECGLWNVKCSCGEVSCFVFREQTCVACGKDYSLLKTRQGDVSGVAEVSPVV